VAESAGIDRRGVVDEADVRLHGVTKRFGEVVAVDDLTLDIDRGEFFSLLGPSGCGKTTTLRMIGGFEEPSEGRIYLRGSDVTGQPPYRRKINTVFQSYALFPHLDVFENVAFGLRRRSVDKRDIRRFPIPLVAHGWRILLERAPRVPPNVSQLSN
jgi:spermidine/putrescine transport system ATP-binding protein